MSVQVQILFDTPQQEIAQIIAQEFQTCSSASLVSGFITVEGVEAVSEPLLTNPRKLNCLVAGAGTYRAYEAFDGLVAAGVPVDRFYVHLGHTRPTSASARYRFLRYHPMLHSKVYLFDRKDKTACAFVGSHNLTGFAMYGLNGEASVMIEGDASSQEISAIRNHINVSKNQAVPYSPTMKEAYQREGYGALMKIARKYGGAFLCDGVGLGKTFVGLMVLERLIRYENKNVLLLVPKSAREPVWQRNISIYLPDLAENIFSRLFVLSHTDLNRASLAKQIEQVKERADAIIIDEAHNFRNPGIAGEGDKRPSRYRILKDFAAGKEMFLLTATPVNNSLLDLMHMIELFEGDGGSLKQAPLGIHSLQGHFRALEKRIAGATMTDTRDL